MARHTLTREQIVQAAIELLDAEGIDGLSMRQLGRKLGTAATAVYWHMNSRDDLLGLAADDVWGEIELPELGEVGWREKVITLANGIYAMIIRHPWLIPAMSTQLTYGPGKARCDDHFLATFEAAGFTQPLADNAYRTVLTFTLGNALGDAAEAAWRTRLRRNGENEEEHLSQAMARVSDIARQFPRLRARLEPFQDDDGDASPDHDLATGLATILNGLEAQLTKR